MLPNIFKEHLFLGNVVTDESMNSTASTELSASISDVDELESADVGNTTCAGFSDDDGIMASPFSSAEVSFEAEDKGMYIFLKKKRFLYPLFKIVWSSCLIG